MAGKPKVYTKELLSRPGMAFAVDIADPKTRVQASMDAYKNSDDEEVFEYGLMAKDLELISATGPPEVKVLFELDVLKKYTSSMGNMQGGAVTLIFDMATTIAAAPLATQDFWWFGGVSRNLNVTFMRPIKLGTRVIIECEVLQMGKRLATLRGTMRDKATGSLLAVCEHNKASIVFAEQKL